MKLKKFFNRRELWAIGIYKIDKFSDILELNEHQPIYMIGEKGIRKDFNFQSTVADPFLFVYRKTLYILYEVKTDHDHGEIWAQSLTEEGNWISHGMVLRENFHLSYPQVFEKEGRIYMIPESAMSGTVQLYESLSFPFEWVKRSTLINEPLRDPTIIIKENNDLFILATTSEYELKLYHSSYINQPFHDTGLIITKDRHVARCAGGIIKVGGLMLRPAQDCSKKYGERISFQNIKTLNLSDYNENSTELKPVISGASWMSQGSHHISCAKFGDSFFVAIDGRRHDRMINSIALGFLRILEKFLYK